MKLSLKRACSALMALVMLLSLTAFPAAATEAAFDPVGAGVSDTTVTLAFKDDAQWNNNATLGDYYSVNIIASSDTGDSFPLCATQVYVRFDPNVLTFVSAQLRNKIASIEVPDPEDPSGETMPVSISSNTLTEHAGEGYIGFMHFMPADLPQNYNTVVNNGQTIATLNFQPASDAARSQTAQLSFVNTTGMTSQVGFFEGLSSTSSTAYTLNLDASHTVPALNPSGSTHTVRARGGTGSGQYAPGTTVTITAGAAQEGEQFSGWTGTDSLTFDRTASAVTFIMPDYDVTVTATYAPISASTHTVTVNRGTGSGTYTVGDSVTIVANPVESQQFDAWTGTDSLTFDRTASAATFTMPDYDVTLTATYAPTPTTDPGTVALTMSGAAWQGDIYSVNITASGGAGDSFPLCGAEIWVHFDPNVLTFASAQLRNKIAPIEVEDPEDPFGDPISVSVSSNTQTSRVAEGYFSFVYFMPPDLTQSYNFPVNNGQTIATLNFRPASDAAQSQASEISFVNAAGMTSQIGFFESTTSTSSTAYTLNLGAAHTVPAFSLSPDVCEIIFAARDWEGNLSVTLTNPNSATLAVSYFDANGKFMSANTQAVAAGAGTASVDIPANAATARVMLFDTDCRPLCAAFEAPLG